MPYRVAPGQSSRSLSELCGELCQASEDAGGDDNATLILVRLR